MFNEMYFNPKPRVNKKVTNYAFKRANSNFIWNILSSVTTIIYRVIYVW